MTSLVLILALFATPAEPAACSVKANSERYHGVEMKSWSGGAERLVLCSYFGYPLEQIRESSWIVSELFVTAVGANASRLLVDVPSDTEATLTANPPRFVLTILTYGSDDNSRVPLVRHELTLTADGISQETFFALAGVPFAEKRFLEHLRAFDDPNTTAEQIEHSLLEMRDMGVTKPTAALRLLATLKHSPRADGHIGEELAKVISELEMARDLPHRRAK